MPPRTSNRRTPAEISLLFHVKQSRAACTSCHASCRLGFMRPDRTTTQGSRGLGHERIRSLASLTMAGTLSRLSTCEIDRDGAVVDRSVVRRGLDGVADDRRSGPRGWGLQGRTSGCLARCHPGHGRRSNSCSAALRDECGFARPRPQGCAVRGVPTMVETNERLIAVATSSAQSSRRADASTMGPTLRLARTCTAFRPWIPSYEIVLRHGQLTSNGSEWTSRNGWIGTRDRWTASGYAVACDGRGDERLASAERCVSSSLTDIEPVSNGGEAGTPVRTLAAAGSRGPSETEPARGGSVQ